VAAITIFAGPAAAFDLPGIRATIDELGLRYTVTENWVTRLAPADRRLLGGALVPDDPDLQPNWRGPTGGRHRARLDWREIDGNSYVSGIRDQGMCGSCWDFAGVAMLESALMIALDQPDTDPDYSEQFVLSCNDIPGCPSSCGGGYLNAALEFMTLAGVPPESCFPYEANDGLPCGFSSPSTESSLQKLQGWSFVTTSALDIPAIKDALALGPVGSWFQIYESFYGYSGGVYSAHGSVYTGGNHLVLIVGFDDELSCWIVKNSWGPYWGEDGYFRIAYDSGCDFGLWTQACTFATSWRDAAWWEPAEPAVGQPMTVFYNPAGRPLQGAPEVSIHRGHNGWQGITDEAMTWNAADQWWEVTFTVPPVAGSVDFVFTDRVETWDNNGGADWLAPVAGAPGFVMDGIQDVGVPLLAATEGLSLWGEWVEGILYLAVEGTGSTPGQDHFLLVTSDTTSTLPAPWAKAGRTLRWDFFLAAENDNTGSGWFDVGEAAQTGPEFAKAQGAVLEGTLDLAALYPGPPAQLWVAAASYQSPDGGALLNQAPAGNGDIDLQVSEYHELANPLTGVETEGMDGEVPPLSPWELFLHPNPFNPAVSVEILLPREEHIRLGVFDLSGQKVAALHDGPAGPGRLLCRWDGRDARGDACASGVYFFRALGEREVRVVKGALLR